jgi:cell division protein FtsQ
MTSPGRYGKIKRILALGAWLVVAGGCATLLIAAIRHQNHAVCKAVRIVIGGVNRRMVDSAELESILTDEHTRQLVGTPSGVISIRRLEKRVGDNPWVKRADLFFDSKQVLWVKVTEREPVARLFTLEGASFYIDGDGTRLPLKDNYPLELPVFTSCPFQRRTWTKTDTAMAGEIAVLSRYLVAHPFWMSMVQQVDVTDDREFELVPSIGEGVLRIGDTSDLEQKFNRLRVFYERVIPHVGWNKYAAVDARYAGQVIGVRRDGANASVDTARAAALLREMIEQGRSAMLDTVVRAAPTPRDWAPDIDSTRSLEAEPDGGAPAAKPPKPGAAAKPRRH